MRIGKSVGMESVKELHRVKRRVCVVHKDHTSRFVAVKAAVEVSMKKSVNETLDYYILSLNTISSIILCSIVSTLVFSQTCISLNAVGRGFCCRYCSSIS